MRAITHSHIRFPLNPEQMTSDHIAWDDIATHLAKQCRYNGAVPGYYSVAEHSVLVSQCVPKHLQFLALLHDAAEAYLGDLVRPVKVQCPAYWQMEDRLMLTIYRAALVEPPSFSDQMEIKAADDAVLNRELEWFFPEQDFTNGQGDGGSVPAAQVNIVGLDWQDARQLFITRFNQVKPGFVDGVAA